MKTIALIFIISIVTQQVFSASVVTFSGNVSTDELTGVKSGEFDFRKTAVWLLPINLGFVSYTLAGYASFGLKGSGNNSSGTVSGDLIVGAIKFFSDQLPLSYMGYLNASVTATRSVVAGTDVTKFDYSGSGGFILTSYNKLEERTPSGSIVRSVALKELVWSVTAGNSSVVTGSGTLHYITLVGSNPKFLGLEKPVLKSGESVSMTFLVSEVLGSVTFGSVTTSVTPKTLESVLEVNQWNYGSPTNKLVFVCGVATGAASGTSSGVVTFASGSGDNQVYAHFSGSVDLGGKKGKVTITKTKTADIKAVINDTSIEASATATYKGNLDFNIVEISFPEGQKNIIYDPSIGSGTPLTPKDDSSAYTLAFYLMSLLIVVLLI